MDDPQALARRLRELRERHWPDMRITQKQLHRAMGISVSLISSWEATRQLTIPPAHRLDMYAAFFATERSIADNRERLLPLSELTPDERRRYRTLLDELTRLRMAVLRSQPAGPSAQARQPQDAASEDPWHFPDGRPITIICSEVPEDHLDRIPYASPDVLDYIELYKYSDLDSLFDLHGHLREANPGSRVNLCAAGDLRRDDLSTHLVLLGGVDYNKITVSMLRRIELPVRQVADWDGENGAYFEVDESGRARRYYPATRESDGKLELVEDIGFFYRGINPFNVKSTLTICNGMYARGVHGVVRALTDELFRDRNRAYLRERFGTATPYSILTRVSMEGRMALTPDWTLDSYRLHEWPEPIDGG
ncbi:helix-turn-helix domain-containing protein [Nonomuraea basaltis]|uniref:helix-turn-helix domain-containing protein n=1 Tax=Nonomuraea basaltis TaxID=2495887 RepID=UPI00110C70D3|nr:helix-turn-helix transcriptional regulator [Nonomuraea basaltis]TMR95403.1 helix-turn-helix transcriptional regulator [Nonomuraea basaltis]